MIDIVQKNQRNLKDIRQIGTPGDAERVYIEKQVYNRIHQDELQEKRVFVMMGHTECEDGCYSTFVEGVIPVREISFAANVPKWDNRAWNEVFREIKRAYEDYIIVGWALDLKGVSPKVTEDMEAVHREQFGGVHQLLFLLDTLENEEYFYINKKNHLSQKGGFYVYQEKNQEQISSRMKVEVELPKEEPLRPKEEHLRPKEDYIRFKEESIKPKDVKPQYRQLMLQQKAHTRNNNFRTYASAAAILLLIGIIGAGAYNSSSKVNSLEHAVSALSQNTSQTDSEEIADTADTEIYEIPLERIPSNLSGETQEASAGQNPIESEPESAEQEEPEQGNSEPDNSEPDNSESEQAEPDSESIKPSDTENPDDTTPADAEINYITHVVSEKETLSGICRKYYQSIDRIDEICTLNEIENPDDIRVGQTLKIPQ